MADVRADDLIRLNGQKKAKRGTFEAHWQEVADLVLPRYGDITAVRTPGEKRQEKIFDSTAQLANERFAAAVESYTAPRGSKWHGLRALPEELNEEDDVREYFDLLRDRLFSFRYAASANFAPQLHEVLISLGAFGTGVLYIGELNGGLRYRSIPIAEAFLGENSAGQVDQMDRVFKQTARQMAQQFGRDKIAEGVRKCLDKEPDREFQVMHAVMPRSDYDERKVDGKNMNFASYWVDVEHRQCMDEGGFRKFPYGVARYVTAPGELYGRSPAMTALAEIKMANSISKTVIRAAELMSFPPTLTTDDGALSKMQLAPNAVIAGGLDAQGHDRVKKLDVGANPGLGVEILQQRREVINDAFLVTLFRILVESPGRITATEVLERAQEKGALIGPALSRLHSDLFGPGIERELDVLAHNEKLPPPPEMLLEMSNEYEVTYDSPLARAQKMQEATATTRVMEFVTANEPMFPGMAKRVDSDQALKIVHSALGAPQRMLRNDDEMKALEEQEEWQKTAAAASETAPIAAGAIKDIALANKAAAEAGAVNVGA